MPWSNEEAEQIGKALAVVSEITGTEFSGPARAYLLRELAEYEPRQVLDGLRRAGRECTGKLTLAAIAKAIAHIDRKLLSDQQAARSHYLTQIRLLAMTENIPWERGEKRVREELEAKGYKFGPPEKQLLPARNLPHWQDKDE